VVTNFILTDYVNCALSVAVYEKLQDGTYSGSIPSCTGVVAFAGTLRECERELQSILEDWILVGLKFGHMLPVLIA
jgi:predicted RNase H-like HicB family nuclease